MFNNKEKWKLQIRHNELMRELVNRDKAIFEEQISEIAEQLDTMRLWRELTSESNKVTLALLQILVKESEEVKPKRKRSVGRPKGTKNKK